MDNNPNNLTSWFAHRPKWLQDAARRIILKGEIDSDDLAELITLCKQEAGLEDSKSSELTFQGIPQDAFQRDESVVRLHLKQISNISGINALAPRKPLTFGEGPLVIIYGGTGSGKSGYVRIYGTPFSFAVYKLALMGTCWGHMRDVLNLSTYFFHTAKV